MPEFLELTVDKFTFRTATDRHYNNEGVWALAEGNRVRIGLSDFLQQRSGDVAFAEVKPEGTVLAFGDEVAVIETIKADISLPSPVAGKVAEVNPAMDITPEVINQDPYGEGWLAVMEAEDWESDRVRLLDPAGYFALPCSGIGKTYGTVSREAAYEVTEDMRPADTQLVALSLLVLGDEDARAAVAGNPAVTIDGCKLACATKMVEESGGTVAQDLAVLDAYRRHRKGIAELNEGGQKLAHVLAEEVAAVVDDLSRDGDENA
jgi:glycine cleavage system H protein